jgi:hypothetical protein
VSDYLANMQDIMGYAGLYGPNPYTPFQNGIPFSGGAGPGIGYLTGSPTQAWSGQPIQPPPGTTLNQTPQTPQAPAPAPAPSQGVPAQYAINNSMINAMGQGVQPGASVDNVVNMRAQNNAAYNQGGFGPGYWGGPGLQAAQAGTLPPGTVNPNMDAQQALAAINAYGAQAGYPSTGGSASAAPAQQGPANGGTGLTRQQYLALASNPGPVPMPSAQGPQAGQTATGSAPPNVLQAFLSTQGGKNTPFINTLNKLQATSPQTGTA